MNSIAVFLRILSDNMIRKNIGKTVLVVTGIIALDLLIISNGWVFAESEPILAVALSWIWFLLPGLLFSFAIVEHVSWWERIPIAFVLTIGLGTPITVTAILLRIELDIYILLHTSILLILAFVLIVNRHQIWQSSENISPFNLKISKATLKGNILLLFIVFIIIVGILVILAREWPLFGDEVAGLSIFAEVIQLNRITGTEPFHGSGVSVTPRNELIVWTYMAILTNKISGTSPTDFFVNSRPILVAIAMLSLATLLSQFLKNKHQTLFFLCLWSIYLFSTTQADGMGSDLITRIIQDKFLGWFVVIPVVLVFTLWFVESRDWSKLIGFGIVTFGASMVHPITLTQAMILIGGFGLIHFVCERSRRTFVNLFWIALVLLLCTAIPFLQYIRFNAYSPVELAGLGSAVEFGRLSSAVGRYRLWLLGAGRYILHPTVILESVIIASYCLMPLIIFQIRKHYAARLIVGAMFMLPVLLYVPTFAALVGQIVTPYLIWRLAWPLPLFAILTIGWVLWLLVHKLTKLLKKNGSQLAKYDFLSPSLIILALILAMPNIKTGLKDYNERRSEINLSTCITANNVLSYLKEISKDKSVNVLSSHELNFCIPGYAALANVVEFRGYGTVNRLSEENIAESLQRVEDVDYFDVSNIFDDLMLESLVRHDIDYILLEKEKLELDLHFKYLPTYFRSVYEDSNYSLYEVRKPIKPLEIVAANTYLRLNQFGNALQSFSKIIQADPKNVLAYLGVGIAQEGLGESELAIISYQKAAQYASNEPAVHAQLASAYMLQEDFSNAIKEYLVAANLSPHRSSIYVGLGQVYILAGQEQDAKASFEKVASLRAVKDTAAYYSILGRLYQSMRLFTEAIEYHERAISIELDSKRYVDLARALSFSGKIDEAIEAYKMASELDRWNSLPHLDLGYLYKNQGFFDEAIREFEIACQLKPTNVSAYILLGQAVEEKSGLEAALSRLEELKSMSSVLPGPHRGIATLLVASGEFDDALQALDFSERIQPKSAAILTAKGFISMANGQFERAYKAFNQALLLNPDLISARLGLSMLYTTEAGFDMETGQLLQIVRLAPTAAWSHLSLAQAYKHQGDWKLANEQIEWAIKLDPNNIEGYIAKGNLNKAQLNFEQAISDYLRALEIDPGNVKALIGLGDVYKQIANFVEAERIFSRAINLDKDSVYPKIRLAEIYWQQGRFEEATALEKAAAQIAPDSDLVLIKLAETYKLLGRIDEAKTLYERVIQTDPNLVAAYSSLAQLIAEEDNDQNVLFSLYNNMLNANPGSAEAYLVTGQFFIDQGEFNKAEHIFKTALNFPDVSVENYLSLSDLQYTLGEWESTLSTLQMATNIFPGNAAVFSKLADFYLKIGDIGKAEIYSKKAIDLDPAISSAYVDLSHIEQIKGNLSLAERVLQNAVTDNPGSPQVFLAMASFQESIGRIYLAEEYLNKAIAIMPTDIKVQQSLGQFYVRQNRYAEALDRFQKALQLPGTKLEINLDIGNLFLAKNQTEEAIGWYQAASSTDKSDVRPYLALANLYQSLEKWNESFEFLKTALTMEPANIDANLAMGELHRRLGHINQARVYIEYASKLDRSQVIPLIVLAEISKNNGDWTQAVNYLDQAIEISPISLPAYTALAQIYQLSGNYSKADEVISQGIQKVIDKQDGYHVRATLHENQGLWDLAKADYEKAWSITPDSKSAGIKLVDFLIRRNNPEHALVTLSQLEKRIGPDAEISIEYGDIYSLQAKWEEALRAYNQALELDNSAKGGYTGLAKIYELRGDISKAIGLYQSAMNNGPIDADVLNRLGKALCLQGRFEEAYTAYQKALKLDPMNTISLINLEQINKITQKPETDLLGYVQNALLAPTPEAFQSIALLYQFRGDWDLAHSWFQRAISLESQNSESWLRLGDYYRTLTQWDRALDAYTQALKYKPASLDILLTIGNVWDEMGQVDAARESYQQVIDVSPMRIEGYIALAKLYFKLGDFEQSVMTINDGITNAPGDIRGYQTLGDIYIGIEPENFLLAEEAYNRGLDILPGAADLYARIGELYTNRILSAKEKIEATKALELLAQYRLEILSDRKRAAATRQQDRVTEIKIKEAMEMYAVYHRRLITAQREYRFEQSSFEAALTNYTSALNLEPANELALIGLGKLYLIRGSEDEAIDYFERALAANPHSNISLSYLGNIYLELGRTDDAVDIFEQILEYEPANLFAHLGRANAYNNLPALDVSQAAASVEQNLYKMSSLVEYFRKVENRQATADS